MSCIDHRLYTRVTARREVKNTPPDSWRKRLCVSELWPSGYAPEHIGWTLHAYSNTLYED